jgi:hypothetical protein
MREEEKHLTGLSVPCRDSVYLGLYVDTGTEGKVASHWQVSPIRFMTGDCLVMACEHFRKR